MAHRSSMTSRERVQAAVRGEDVDRPPIGLWRHFPEQDQRAEDLAASTLAWQHQFGFDLIKFMPPGDYAIIDWGAESRFEGAPGGTRTTSRFPITGPADWTTLKPVDPHVGFNGMVLDALRRTRQQLDPAVPIFQTIFSPFTIAMKLSAGTAVEHARSHPDELHAALAVISGVTRKMLEASFEAGADGIFFATQAADTTFMEESEYRDVGLRYDLEVMEGARDRGWTMLHLHGEAPMFELGIGTPADILNWHDRRAAPDLATGQRQSGRCVAGGINERTIVSASPAEAAAEARDAVEQTGGRHLIVAPGCVIPVATPEETIRGIVDVVVSHT